MGLLGVSAKKDLKRQFRDPVAITLWCGIPLLISALMALAFGGGTGRTPQARLLVVDQDDSLGSRLLTAALGQAGGLIETETVGGAAGRARIESGDASALLQIPAGFGDAVLHRRPATLELITNPAQSILPGIVEETLSIFVDAVFYLQELAGEPLARMASAGARPPTPEEAAEVAARFAEIAGGLRGFLDPPLVDVETEVVAPQARAPAGFGLLVFPGTLLMAVMFVAQGMSDDIWREKEQGTLRRVMATPCSVPVFLGGRLLAVAAMLALVCGLALTAGAAAFGLARGRLPVALVWSVASGVVLYAMFLALQILGSTRRAASILTNMVLFPLLMMGGSFFPFEALPGWMASIGRLTPNGWVLSALKDILAGSAEPAAIAVRLAGLLAAGAALFAFAAVRVRRAFAQA